MPCSDIGSVGHHVPLEFPEQADSTSQNEAVNLDRFKDPLLNLVSSDFNWQPPLDVDPNAVTNYRGNDFRVKNGGYSGNENKRSLRWQH